MNWFTKCPFARWDDFQKFKS